MYEMKPANIVEQYEILLWEQGTGSVFIVARRIGIEWLNLAGVLIIWVITYIV